MRLRHDREAKAQPSLDIFDSATEFDAGHALTQT